MGARPQTPGPAGAPEPSCEEAAAASFSTWSGTRIRGPLPLDLEEIPMRDIIKMTCAVCSRANYHTTKNKRTMTEKFVIKKFCPACRKHNEHKEGKISKG
jgi:large subunit ribosomal protein L33